MDVRKWSWWLGWPHSFSPHVAVGAGPHIASLSVVGAPLGTWTIGEITRARAGEAQSGRRFLETVFRWTCGAFAQRVSQDVLLPQKSVGTGSEGAVVCSASVVEVVVARLHTSVNTQTHIYKRTQIYVHSYIYIHAYTHAHTQDTKMNTDIQTFIET